MKSAPYPYTFNEHKEAYNFFRLMRELSTIRSCYPFVTIERIGHSVLGLPIPHLLIGNGKKVIHINASFHANEWITTNVLMLFVKEYAEVLQKRGFIQGEKADKLYEHVTLSIVPMVNPDGVNLVVNGPLVLPEPSRSFVIYTNRDFEDYQGWKANIRGVDLNNQFPANWEIEKKRKIPKTPYPRDYPGGFPLSEPEVIAIVHLTERIKPDMVIALHTQGKEFYWGYMGKEPLQSGQIAREMAKISLYKSIRNIDSHAGYKDWFILNWNRPGFTIELGKGINPLPLSQIPQIYKECRGILLTAMQMV